MNSNQFIILTPVYNDWEALCRLLPSLDRELSTAGYRASVLVVDDGSTSSPSPTFPSFFQSIIAVDIISLKRNLGHQRAIAVGLAYIAKKMSECSVVIMDADGEDDPHDVPRLIDACIINLLS